MKHEDYKELVALDALDALDGEAERRTLAAHLADCADCRAELDAQRAVAASLAYAAPPAAPALELRAQILARIKSQPQQQVEGQVDEQVEEWGARLPASSGSGAVITTTPSAPAADASNVSAPDEFAKRREARDLKVSRRLLVFGALAASLAVAALLLSLLMLWQRNNALQNEIAQLSANADRSAQELARARVERELLASPEAQTAKLAGTKMAANAQARLTFNERTGHAMLMAADLPPAPAGKAYQLWFIAAGKPPMPGSVFQTNANGHAEMHGIVPPEGRASAVVFAVTLEPESGTSAPTGEIYLKGSAS
jgi:hypothetical protein